MARQRRVPRPEQLVNGLLLLYTLSTVLVGHFLAFIAVSSKLSLSQALIFTFLCLQFSSLAAAAGGEE